MYLLVFARVQFHFFFFFSKLDFHVYIQSGLLISSLMSFPEVPVIIVIYDAGGGKKTWPFLSVHP